jgi:hypothetical protein
VDAGILQHGKHLHSLILPVGYGIAILRGFASLLYLSFTHYSIVSYSSQGSDILISLYCMQSLNNFWFRNSHTVRLHLASPYYTDSDLPWLKLGYPLFQPLSFRRTEHNNHSIHPFGKYPSKVRPSARRVCTKSPNSGRHECLSEQVTAELKGSRETVVRVTSQLKNVQATKEKLLENLEEARSKVTQLNKELAASRKSQEGLASKLSSQSHDNTLNLEAAQKALADTHLELASNGKMHKWNLSLARQSLSWPRLLRIPYCSKKQSPTWLLPKRTYS